MPTKQELLDEIYSYDATIKCKSFNKQKLIEIRDKLINDLGAGSTNNDKNVILNRKWDVLQDKLKRQDREIQALKCKLRCTEHTKDYYKRQVESCDIDLTKLNIILLKKRINKAKDDLKNLSSTILDLTDNNDINDKANIKINDELLKIYNDLNGEPTNINRT